MPFPLSGGNSSPGSCLLWQSALSLHHNTARVRGTRVNKVSSLTLVAILKLAGCSLASRKGPELRCGSVSSAGRLRMRRRPGWGWWNAPNMSCSSLSMSSTKRKVRTGGGRTESRVWMGTQQTSVGRFRSLARLVLILSLYKYQRCSSRALGFILQETRYPLASGSCFGIVPVMR